MNFITVLIICLIYLFKFNEALVLKTAQLTAAQSFIQTLYGIPNYVDPCTYPTGLFSCAVSGTEYVVTDIIISNSIGGDLPISFEAFVDVITIKIGESITASGIWENINSLTKLQSLYIGSQSIPIPTNTILPTTSSYFQITFVNINVGIPDCFFSTGDMYSLNIINSNAGFSLPTTLSTVNTKFQVLQMPINSAYSSLPTNMNTKLLGLFNIYLKVYNDKNVADYATSFPTFDTPFTKLDYFAIQFSYSSNFQTYTLPNSIMNLGSSTSFSISGNGFNLPSSGTVDFSSYKSGSALGFQKVGFFDQCTSIKCLLIPVARVNLQFTSNNINMSYIDFTNVTSISVFDNKLSQPLPTLSTFDLSKISLFSLTGSQFTGTIPSSYCNFQANSYFLGLNQLSGIVPTCFSCVGGNFDGTNNLFGGSNSYSNGYTLTSPPSTCPTYSIDDIPSGTIFKTNQNTIITISGTDFGWSYQILATQPPAPILSILVPNSKITLTIPKGDGSNKQLSVKFGGNYQFTKTFNYSYEAPVLVSKYYWTTLNGDNVLTLIGTGFSYINSNIIILNGVEITVPAAVTSTIDSTKDQIILPLSTTSQLSLGDTMVISVKVADQTSGTVNFIYNNPFSMTTKDLYTIGGSITFDGTFGVPNNVTLSIGGIEYAVKSITSTSITFTYPMLAEGDYNLSLNIGGLDMSTTQVTVIKSPEPTLLSKYSWATINNVNVMVLTGTSFGYYEPNPNSVLINGESNVAAIAKQSSTPGYDQITINEDVLSSLTAGDLFTIEVKVLDQTSDAVNLNLIYPISMTTKQLYTLGGSITFNGVFSTSDKELALLSIDGDACTIVELTPTTISFTYPSFVIGDYDLYLEIGCVDYSSTVTYIKPPPPTLLNNYSWRTLIGGENVLVLTGTGFNYQDVSSVLINGVSFESTIAVASSKAGYDEITFEDDTATNSFTEDELFTVVVDVDSQQSNLVNFNFIKLISVNSVTLNTTGGDVSFTGVYGTSNKSIVSLSINNIECTINSINPTTITFTYPAITNAGEYNYNLNIGGLSYSSIVKYVVPVTPTDTPTVTPTTPTTTSPTTTSSSDDQPSNSIRLSISFILSTLTFSLLLLIL